MVYSIAKLITSLQARTGHEFTVNAFGHRNLRVCFAGEDWHNFLNMRSIFFGALAVAGILLGFGAKTMRRRGRGLRTAERRRLR